MSGGNVAKAERPCLMAVFLFLSLAGARIASAEEKAPVSPLDELVCTEREFSKTSVEKGTREAFLAFFTEEGVFFQPHPVKARKTLREGKASADRSKAVLEWEPRFADVSAAGDFGYTSGPYTVTNRSGQKQVLLDQGFFFSIWRKKDEGWRVILDAGISTPPFSEPLARKTVEKGSAHRQNWRALQFLGADSAIYKDVYRLDLETLAAFKQDHRRACETFLAPEVRLLRDGEFPVTGCDQVCEDLARLYPVESWEPMVVGLGDGGDLGYVYGRFERKDNEKGYFVRIWKRRLGAPWQIAAEVLLPRPLEEDKGKKAEPKPKEKPESTAP